MDQPYTALELTAARLFIRAYDSCLDLTNLANQKLLAECLVFFLLGDGQIDRLEPRQLALHKAVKLAQSDFKVNITRFVLPTEPPP